MSSLPSFHTTISPEFDSRQDNAVSALDITLRITDTRSKASRPLLELYLNWGPTPSLRYDGDALQASDDNGHLNLSNDEHDGVGGKARTWFPGRDPAGVVVVRFKTIPRHTDAKTPPGPRLDLRTDQGGVIGSGAGFLPHPGADEDWDVRVDFELPDSAPAGTRVAWSLGDGLSSRATGHPKELVGNSIFAIGKLQRFPSWESEMGDGQRFAMYWIGSPPYNMDRIPLLTEKIFLSIATFFNDTSKPFRVFVRRVWNGHGGLGAHRSFLLEYDAVTKEQQSEDGLIGLLAHETVHVYPLMMPASYGDAWYNEGVANYYSVIAPFQNGGVDRKYLIKMLNENAQAYYTTQVIDLKWDYIVNHYFERFDITKAGYGRGFIYLVQVQGLINQASKGQKGVDDIVLALYQRQLNREEHHSNDFHQLVSEFIGKEETDRIRASMEGGEIIVPPADSFAKYGLKMIRHDVEKFEPGFHPNSLRTHKINGLVSGSRADEAGIREGDEVAESWMLWGAGDSLKNMMQVTVLRDGKRKAFNYWPRSHQKVENWIWVEKEEDA